MRWGGEICVPPMMLLTDVALMLGVGASVVSSFYLANNNIKAARVKSTQTLVVATIVVFLFLAVIKVYGRRFRCPIF